MTRLIVVLIGSALAMLGQVSNATFEGLDRAWAKAIVAKDTATLDKLLAPHLVYAHASGVVDTKAEYIAKISGGKQVYKTLDQKNVTVHLYPGMAITHSWVRVTGVNPQGPFDDKIMMLHVWAKVGDKWQLAAHQTTRVDKLP